MNPLLTRLGVPPEIQAFFNLPGTELIFSYGDDIEHYGSGFHKIPTTENVWLAGFETAIEVIITFSAMEGIAFLSLNRLRYPKLDNVAIVAIGNRLNQPQIDWIRRKFPKRKFTLVFGKDLIGQITDIKVAAGLKNRQVKLFHRTDEITIHFGNEVGIFQEKQLTFCSFQRAFGLRGRIRTYKPRQTTSFLDQLVAQIT